MAVVETPEATSTVCWKVRAKSKAIRAIFFIIY
jgi:hypothetical protein